MRRKIKDYDWKANKRNIPNLLTYTWLMRLAGLFLGINTLLMEIDGLSIMAAIAAITLGFVKSSFVEKRHRDFETTVGMLIAWLLYSILLFYPFHDLKIIYASIIEIVLFIICIILTKHK